MRLHVKISGIVSLIIGVALLSACATGFERDAPAIASRSIVNGPASDYPVVLGDPFTIDGVEYRPDDSMNYDEVGYAAADASAGGVSAAHKTLPMPSYVEVTSLESGRTALVRVERRGPMTNHRLLALSGQAMSQLGIAEGEPIRVRRVNPPEAHRAELRAGREAPLRMETPPGLLEVLRRELPATGSASLHDPRQEQVSGRTPGEVLLPALDPTEAAAVAVPPADATESPPAPEPAVPAPALEAGNFAVQIGAFAVHANAERLAAKVGGTITSSGDLALVRTGPYASRGQAEQALAKLRAQGYSDAQIVTLR